MPEFEKRCMRYARPVGKSWRVDETYIRVGGQWRYLYRAVDKRVVGPSISGCVSIALARPCRLSSGRRS